MSDDDAKNSFLRAAEAWVCDGYSADIRFIADAGISEHSIWAASIFLNPLPPNEQHSFLIESENIVVGQIQASLLKKEELMSILNMATEGVVKASSKPLRLVNQRPYYFHSEMISRDRWFYQMHLQIGGAVRPLPTPTELASIDNQLRTSTIPFDGLLDVATWLELGELGRDSRATGMHIRINPPVDLIFDRCRLADDKLKLTLHAHPEFDCSHVGLAVRATPGDSIRTRRQVADEIKWGDVSDGRKEGTAEIALKNADGALAILMLGQDPIRRQWFTDATKARNNRLLAVQHFDENLRMIKRGVLESGEQAKFELGISSLLFLLGFSPSIQSETDSPDIIVTTPGGRVALVECTMRVADFATKVGKLVDRRGSLTKSLQASGHPAEIAAVLICRQPRDQISAQADDLRSLKVILLSEEDLNSAFDRVRFQNDPDALLQEAESELDEPQRSLFG